LPEIGGELSMPSNEWRSARPPMAETFCTAARRFNRPRQNGLFPFNCPVEPFMSHLKQFDEY
jgi:hypothetical protein